MKIEMSDLQKKLLPMLAWYHDFCVKNGLRYYLLGGTLLGAVRHKGFIPWDDDLDVGMPRKDYERFLDLTKGKKYCNYVVEGIDTNNLDFYYGYTKVYDTTTTLVENTRYQIKRGIYIDVFPLDGVCQSEKDRNKFFFPILRRYQLLLARTCGINKNRKWYKNLCIRIARAIPGIDNKALMLKIDDMCKKYDYDNCEYVGNFYGNWGIREVVRKEIIGVPVIYEFENLEVFGVEDYDSYLTRIYGDWRKLPSKEKQVTHHDYVWCDLNMPYM